MTIPLGLVLGYDATRVNIPHLPRNGAQVAGYDTGSGDVPWDPANFTEFPRPLHICQEAGFGNPDTSDYIDVERFAATNAEAVEWWPRAKRSYDMAKRPGQRWPSVYTSADNVPSLLTAFENGGISRGPGLIIANWSITEQQSELEVLTEAGDAFPVVGAQFAAGPFYDVDLFLVSWLITVSQRLPFAHVTVPGDTFSSVADQRDASLGNLIRRTVEHSDAVNIARLGDAVLVPGTEYFTVNP